MSTPTPDARRTTPAFALALALLGSLTWGSFQAWQQLRRAPGTVLPAEALTASLAARNHDLSADKNPSPAPGPVWIFSVSEYNALFNVLASPKAFHTIKLPISNEYCCFTGYISSVSDEVDREESDGTHFNALTCRFTAKLPSIYA